MQNNSDNNYNMCEAKIYKLYLLRDPFVAYKLRLSQKLSRIDDSTPSTMYDNLVKEIHQDAKESLGLTENTNRKTKYWWSDTLEDLVKRKKVAYSTWLSTKDLEDRKYYARVSRETKKEIIKAQNNYWDGRCEEVSNYLGSSRSKEKFKK